MKKISVIMPCLNVVPYIKECIDSVVNQTIFEELEVLVIDAGSTDGTYEIASYYDERFENIRVIRSDKKSYGYQVNLGIRESVCPYVAILETDDYAKPEMYETLYNVAESIQVDYVKADFEMFYECANRKRIIWDIRLSKDSSLYNEVVDATKNAFLYVHDFSVWKGIYRKDFLIDNAIAFNETSGAAYQDIGFGQKLHSCAKRAFYIPDLLYCYRVGREQASVNSGRGIVYSCEEFKRLLQTWDINKLCLKGTYEAMLSSFLGEFGLISSFEMAKEKQIVESISWFGETVEQGISNGVISEEEILDDLGENTLCYFREIQKNPQKEIERVVLGKCAQMQEYSALRFLNNPVYVFGAGAYGKKLLRVLDSLNVKVQGFFDNGAKEKQQVAGYEVILPCKDVIPENAKVIIANKEHKDDIRRQLVDMGVAKKNILEYGVR